MLRAALSKKLICAALFPFSSIPNQDEKQPKIPPYRIYMEKLEDIMWNENGHPTKELQSVINATTSGALTGFIFGGVATTRSTVETFKKENQATLFENVFEAQKQLRTKISVNFIKGGLRFATKLGLFCFIFSSALASIYVYKGKFDILNYIYSGAITGFLFKINMGMKGAFSGTLIGTILGTISGTIAVCLLWVTGCNSSDIYEYNKIRNSSIMKASSLSYLSKEENKMRVMYKENQKLDPVYVQQQKE